MTEVHSFLQICLFLGSCWCSFPCSSPVPCTPLHLLFVHLMWANIESLPIGYDRNAQHCVPALYSWLKFNFSSEITGEKIHFSSLLQYFSQWQQVYNQLTHTGLQPSVIKAFSFCQCQTLLPSPSFISAQWGINVNTQKTHTRAHTFSLERPPVSMYNNVSSGASCWTFSLESPFIPAIQTAIHHRAGIQHPTLKFRPLQQEFNPLLSAQRDCAFKL